ncbi:MAG: TonB-dependent receptor domain-containing protein [Terriglobia bacterium]
MFERSLVSDARAMNRYHKVVFGSGIILVFLLLLNPGVASAQLYSGSLSGVVTDASGAVVPGAAVTLTDVQKGFKYTTTTNATGNYLLRPLPPANYSLTVKVSGFKTFAQNGIVLAVNQSAEINVSLEIGSTTQEVNVTGTAPLLQTQDATTGQEVNRNFINMMPLVGRGAMDLTFLAPGVNPAPGWTFGSITGEFTSNNFTSNGGRNATSNVLVDGVSATGTEQNGGIQTVLYTPSVDDVQEFNVQQNSYSAQFGSSANTVVNIVTRSGTNQFHGSAYEFFRHQALDSNNWFSNADGINLPPLRYNDFGGTAGGPIQKNKMFFFADYEGSREHTLSTFIAGVPSTAERQGDFSELCSNAGGTFDSGGTCSDPDGQLWDPYSGVYDPNVGGAVRSALIPFNSLANYASPGNPNLVGTPFQLAVQPGNLIDPVAQKMMSYFPLPNVGVRTASYNQYNNWAGNGINIYDHDQFDVKIDRRFGARDTLSGRFTYGRNPNVGASCFKNFLDPCSSGPSNFDTHAVALNNVLTLSPSTVLTASAGFTRELHQNPGVAAGYYPSINPVNALGLPSYMSASGVDSAPYIEIDGGYYGSGLGQQPWSIIRYAQETYDFSVVLDHMRGRQELKFGMNAVTHRVNEGQPGTPTGYFDFSQFGTSQGPYYGGGDGMATFLTGTSTTGWGQYEYPAYIATINPEYAGFFQDNFRVNSKLTLNMGVRYEVTVPRTERHNRIDWFDPTAPSPLGNIPGVGPLMGNLVYASPGDRSGTNINWNGFAPRFGLAYRLSSKLVFRGGYGIYFAPSEWGVCGASGCTSGFDGFDTTTNQQTTYNYDGATPWGRLSNPFPNGFILPLTTPVPKGGDSLFNIGNGIDPLLRNLNNLPYTQTWNAGFQYELPGNVVVSANYIGTKGTHLYFYGSPGLSYLGKWIESASPTEITNLKTYVNNPFYGIITDPNAPLSASQVQAYELLYQYPQYTGIWPGHAPEANSAYDALQVQVNKHMSQGLEFLINYTWSKSIDTASVGTNTTWLGGFGETVDPNNLEIERSLSEYNIPQVLNVAYVYQLPFGRGRHWAANWNKWAEGFLGGWQTSGMWRFDDGQPLSVSTNGTEALPTYSQRADLIGQLLVNPRSKWFCSDPGCGYFSNQGPGQASTDVVTDPLPDTIGSAPRTLPNGRIPGTNTEALGVFKEIPLQKMREGAHLEFRAESFNALNHPQFCGPNTNIDNGNFGVISSQCNSPREVQLGLKLYW